MSNIVFVLTDTSSRHNLGCYGDPAAQTPNADRLAAEGVRFDRSYSSSPVCTPARGCVFTGLHAPVNGAWYNDATPYSNVPLMGEIFSDAGVRVGYTGKWHLDGGLYFGYGQAQGGFPQRWWYDGRRYLDDLGPERAAAYRRFGRLGFEEKRQAAFATGDCWGHRIVDRAIDFLETAGDEPFLLCVAFDEPHAPYMCPTEFLDRIDAERMEIRPNVNAPLEDKPAHQRICAEGHDNTPEDLRSHYRTYAACASFLDAELGRLVDTVDRLHGDDTIVVFTTDHGEQAGSHGCWGKGYTFYEENVHTPLIVRGPGVRSGASCDALVGQVDLMPTFCELAGIETPGHLQGRSFAPCLTDPSAEVNDAVLITYTRFGNDGEPAGDDRDREALELKRTQEFYPKRAIVSGRYKLVVNLMDTDELYDLEADPYEMSNLIGDPARSADRDRLHDRLLDELVATRDPMRCRAWRDRPWRAGR